MIEVSCFLCRHSLRYWLQMYLTVLNQILFTPPFPSLAVLRVVFGDVVSAPGLQVLVRALGRDIMNPVNPSSPEISGESLRRSVLAPNQPRALLHLPLLIS